MAGQRRADETLPGIGAVATRKGIAARALVAVPVAQPLMPRRRNALAVLGFNVLDRGVALHADLDVAELVIRGRIALVDVAALLWVEQAEDLAMRCADFFGAILEEPADAGGLIAGGEGEDEEEGGAHQTPGAVQVHAVIETVCAAVMLTESRVRSPPPPVTVTEPCQPQVVPSLA